LIKNSLGFFFYRINYRLRIYLFSSEQAAYFVPIQIGIGHCIAGYVAWKKETVRVNNITTVKSKISF